MKSGLVKSPKLALVIPCYNEEEIIVETIEKTNIFLKELIDTNKVSEDSFIKFVDDGSVDSTWEIISSNATKYDLTTAIKLSKNEGHQNALIAGMESVADRCDCIVTLDADLQQDMNAIYEMLERYQEGYEVVLGIRTDRSSDTLFKKMTALGYYKIMQLMGVDIDTNHADYRLLSNRALKFILQLKERNIFLRGAVKLIGLKSTKVYFKTRDRVAGESKYPLSKMLSFAWNGITSFSVFPLKMITVVGFIIFVLSIAATLHSLYIVIFTDEAVPGWASTVLPIYFIGGIQLLSIGIIGEYLGKVYIESKSRPRYFIEEELK
ncbi:Glycosyltransferase [hydrothermal vent metagenome]|uniref:Glycosyltransferase n=1 Tax=hydrothermal vent metagenome TaxID=652676 RepID=A0A1W1B9M3_9ZZZZ